MSSYATDGLWLGFTIFIILALYADMRFVDHHPRYSPNTSMRHALYWSILWISLALIFNVILWLILYLVATPQIATQKSLDFLAGYLVEKMLSVDNLFVFYMIFHQFHIPTAYQKRVFTYGIWGAIIFRLIFILLGVYLVNQFHFLLYVMGAFLIMTGFKMFFFDKKEGDLSKSALYRMIHRVLPMTDELPGEYFYVIQKNRVLFTRLFIALIFIELSDILFAFDSIPAIMAITRDPFIIWSSNIFAIMGLRALYFILASMVERFRLLKYGVALILLFVGAKMLLESWVQISTLFSLGVIISILVSFILMSIIHPMRGTKKT